MTKAEIVLRVADKCGCNKKSALAAVQGALDVVKDSIQQGRSIHLQGFGVFAVISRRSQVRRNPKTGAKMDAPPKNYLHFRPAHPLVATINQ